ncbi:winged helix-turn-helix domain-containing protein [Paracoccus methylarcula]|nr:helix-turn-helix domain-containing protein [Paracoccus methylarcula]
MRKDGTTIHFSRQEHALLLQFIRHPHTLITRSELLEALGGKSGKLSERNIDYLVNRLRKRLGDTARDSRFIATRYGDGYVWVADPVKSKPISAFLLVGPVYGSSDDQDAMGDFPGQLASAIAAAAGGQQTVIPCPDWNPDPQGHDDLDFTLDISTHIETDHVHLALALREGRSRRIIGTFRRTWLQDGDYDPIDDLSHEIACALWRHASLTDTGSEVDLMSLDVGARWPEAVAYLHLERENGPAGPEIPVMLALNNYEKLIRSIYNAPMTRAAWGTLEAEIEDLALRALPDAHDNPQLLLAIAKLLRFINRGYLELAARLTDEALGCSTSFAEVYAMKGQIQASSGKIGAAVALYDKAIRMIEPNSRFHAHLLILKIFSLMAEDNRAAAYNAIVDLHSIVPVNKAPFGLLFVPPKTRQLCSDAERMLAAMSQEDGRHLSGYMFNAWARQFQKYEHQQNVLKGFTCHLQRHHGSTSIDLDVAKRFPNLMASVTGAQANNHPANELSSFVYLSSGRSRL